MSNSPITDKGVGLPKANKHFLDFVTEYLGSFPDPSFTVKVDSSMLLDEEPISIKYVKFDFPSLTFTWKFVFIVLWLCCLALFMVGKCSTQQKYLVLSHSNSQLTIDQSGVKSYF